MSGPTPEIHTLNNGIRVVVEPMPGAQSLVVAFRFAFGAKDDPSDRLGLTRIAEDVLFKGTPDRDARAIFDAFDGLGIRRSSSTSVEHTSFVAQVLPDKVKPALELYAELFRSASFPDNEVEIAKIITLEELKRLEDNPIQQAIYTTLRSGAWARRWAESPWANPIPSLPSRLRRCVAIGMGIASHPICSLAWQAVWLPTPAMEAIGDVFGGWAGASSRSSKTPCHLCCRPQCTLRKALGTSPYLPALSQRSKGHALYYAGQLAIAILSGGGSSRLFTEVREKRGLAYSVSAFYQAYRSGGLMTVYAGTKRTAPKETLDVCLSELVRLGKDITAEELERAKTVLKGHLFTLGDLPEAGPRASSRASSSKAACEPLTKLPPTLTPSRWIRFRNTPKHFPPNTEHSAGFRPSPPRQKLIAKAVGNQWSAKRTTRWSWANR